jgi:hypothetical protein
VPVVKIPHAAIAAFRQAKTAEPPPGLVIKTINAQHHHRERQERQEALRAVTDVTDVTLIEAALTRQQAWDPEVCCDILLSLHRAEGFGLIQGDRMSITPQRPYAAW